MPREKYVFIPQRKPCQQCDSYDEDADVADDLQNDVTTKMERRRSITHTQGSSKRARN